MEARVFTTGRVGCQVAVGQRSAPACSRYGCAVESSVSRLERSRRALDIVGENGRTAEGVPAVRPRAGRRCLSRADEFTAAGSNR